MRKLTTKEFVERAIARHGNEYDYGTVFYQLAAIKVMIICRTHGGFSQTPNNHLKGQGCPKCCIELGKNNANKKPACKPQKPQKTLGENDVLENWWD